VPVIWGSGFTIYTDHKPLSYTLGHVSVLWSTCQCRHFLAYIPEFTSDIQHISGTDNITTDMLSHPPGNVTPLQWPGMVAFKTAALETPSGSAAAVATPAGFTVASIMLPQILDYRKMAANQQTCRGMLKAAMYPVIGRSKGGAGGIYPPLQCVV
jgi:hypothetical protein